MKQERARRMANKGLPDMVQVLRTASTADHEVRMRLAEGIITQLGVSFAGEEVNDVHAANRGLVVDMLVMRVQGRFRCLGRIHRPRLLLEQLIREAPYLLLLARAVEAAGLDSSISHAAGRALLFLHDHHKAACPAATTALAG